jgi:hypothetical protein
MNKQISFPALLHVEELPGKNLNFKLEGDGPTVALMLATAIEYDKGIASAIITSLIIWACKTNNLEALIEQLRNAAATYPDLTLTSKKTKS